MTSSTRSPGDCKAASVILNRMFSLPDTRFGSATKSLDTKVTSDFVAEPKRVSGKENILFKMTEAALQSPGERVEDVIYPAVPGGHETLVALLREYKAKGT